MCAIPSLKRKEVKRALITKNSYTWLKYKRIIFKCNVFDSSLISTLHVRNAKFELITRNLVMQEKVKCLFTINRCTFLHSNYIKKKIKNKHQLHFNMVYQTRDLFHHNTATAQTELNWIYKINVKAETKWRMRQSKEKITDRRTQCWGLLQKKQSRVTCFVSQNFSATIPIHLSKLNVRGLINDFYIDGYICFPRLLDWILCND